MRCRFVLALCLVAPLVVACDKENKDNKEGSEAGDKAEGAKSAAASEGGGDKPATCDAGGELAEFLDVFAKGDADGALEKIGFPFSGDSGRWIETEEEIREGIKEGGKPFESLAINAFDESSIGEPNKEWLEQVRGKYPDVMAFDVIATRKESHTKMSAYWFVDPETCKVVGMDDY